MKAACEEFNDIREAFSSVYKAFKEFVDTIVKAWNTLIIPFLKEIEVPEKKSHIPVKEIKPNKVIVLSKRSNVYYCRNNC